MAIPVWPILYGDGVRHLLLIDRRKSVSRHELMRLGGIQIHCGCVALICNFR